MWEHVFDALFYSFDLFRGEAFFPTVDILFTVHLEDGFTFGGFHGVRVVRMVADLGFDLRGKPEVQFLEEVFEMGDGVHGDIFVSQVNPVGVFLPVEAHHRIDHVPQQDGLIDEVAGILCEIFDPVLIFF